MIEPTIMMKQLTSIQFAETICFSPNHGSNGWESYSTPIETPVSARKKGESYQSTLIPRGRTFVKHWRRSFSHVTTTCHLVVIDSLYLQNGNQSAREGMVGHRRVFNLKQKGKQTWVASLGRFQFGRQRPLDINLNGSWSVPDFSLDFKNGRKRKKSSNRTVCRWLTRIAEGGVEGSSLPSSADRSFGRPHFRCRSIDLNTITIDHQMKGSHQ